MYRGSRKHVLDWTDQPAFLGELFGLMPEIPLKMDEDVQWNAPRVCIARRGSTPDLWAGLPSSQSGLAHFGRLVASSPRRQHAELGHRRGLPYR